MQAKKAWGQSYSSDKNTSGKPHTSPRDFFTEFEKEHSIKELELLSVVWATENFKNFVYGTEFEIVSDHKAWTTILKVNWLNKTFH